MRLLLVGLIWCCLATVCDAQRTVPADKPIHVKLELDQPTSLAFPEVIDSVQWTKFGNDEAQQRMSLNSRGPYCFLTLRDESYSGRLFVLGVSGRQYPVFFKHGTPGDIVVHIGVAPATPTKAVPVDVAGVLRALWTQQALPGQQPTDVAPPAMPDTRMLLVESQAVAVAGYVGLTLHLRNTSAQLLALDVRLDQPAPPVEGTVALAAWAWAPRLTVKALAATQELVGAGEDTQVFVVLERRN